MTLKQSHNTTPTMNDPPLRQQPLRPRHHLSLLSSPSPFSRPVLRFLSSAVPNPKYHHHPHSPHHRSSPNHPSRTLLCQLLPWPFGLLPRLPSYSSVLSSIWQRFLELRASAYP